MLERSNNHIITYGIFDSPMTDDPAGQTMLRIEGMHGLGDNLHQRAIIRQLLTRHDFGTVQLETPWPSVYHDLVGSRFAVVHKLSSLRTQAKNAKREAAKYSASSIEPTQRMRVWYTPDEVRARGSVLSAMVASAGCDASLADFRLPIPPAWHVAADELIATFETTRPLLIVRPLVVRPEWSGCAARNPDAATYATLFAAIRSHFFVVSIADLEPGKEWLASDMGAPDVAFHEGQLPFETLAALFARAALVYCSPGFAVILAQAVGTPSICVFGGYENSKSFTGGARFAPYLGVDPINSCQCFKHGHACDKRVDVPAAIERCNAFLNSWCPP